jgi:hypothetical protein
MTAEARNLLLRALSERIPYQTAIEPLDGTPGGILKCTDWEGHVWITGHKEAYDVEEVLPLLRKFEDLSQDEVNEIFTKILKPNSSDPSFADNVENWHFTEDGQPYCDDSVYSLYFAPNVIDDYLHTVRSHWVDTLGLIDKGLAIRVNNLNNPYRIKFNARTPFKQAFSAGNWMVLPLKK